jgi:formamidopyrimidine-DNA glycosylase
MPELPEVETVRSGLEPVVAGRTIVEIRVHEFAGVVGELGAASFTERVRGRRIEALRRRGKYLIAHLDDGSSLLIHLRMTGNLIRVDRSAPRQRFEHLAIELDDGTDLRFADQRKFGRVLHVSPQEIATLDERLGPEPFSPHFSAQELGRRLGRRSGRLKSVLLDQSLVAGLGNIYVDEALFEARIHPQRDAGSLSPAETARLHRAIRAVLRQGLGNRGTSISSFRDGYGQTGSNQYRLKVYGRGDSDSPCLRCGTAIVRLTIGGRSSHCCPTCQPLPGS